MKERVKWKYFIVLLCIAGAAAEMISCEAGKRQPAADSVQAYVDTTKMPGGKYGAEVRYGRELMLHTAYYIGPEGVNGRYTGNKMNCTNCHRDAGLRPYAFNLVHTFKAYPQYRAREGKVLSLAERINNCVMRPNLGRPLPMDSREMVAIMAWLKYISDSATVSVNAPGIKNMHVALGDRAASPERGEKLYAQHCLRCHGGDGEGIMQMDNKTYIYPPVWGKLAYRPGSSMHRVITLARWLKGNMPYDKTPVGKPYLTDDEALDIAAYVNDDVRHARPAVKTTAEPDYPHADEKPIDYGVGPFNDPFTALQHKYGPFKPIADYWKKKGRKLDI